MEKEQDQNKENKKDPKIEELKDSNEETLINKENEIDEEIKKDLTPEEKILDLEDKLTRAFAEMENQRRRFEKEKEDAFDYGGFSFARETLNLIDNLERSKINLENDEKVKRSEGFKEIINHLDVIYKDMISILKKNNIYPIESVGKKLDPNIHQAMMEIEDESKESGIILQEIQKGFMMKDRLLRPALVGVAKKVSKKEQNSSENDEKTNEKSK